jgi:2-methylcitrate dehydratase PrpD
MVLEERQKDEKIAALAAKVKVIMDPELERVYLEEGEQTARVEIVTAKGERFSEYVKVPDGRPAKSAIRQ